MAYDDKEAGIIVAADEAEVTVGRVRADEIGVLVSGDDADVTTEGPVEAGETGAKVTGDGVTLSNEGQLSGGEVGVKVTGEETDILNSGSISGPVAIDATESEGSTNLEQSEGEISGEVRLGSGDDNVEIEGGEVNGTVRLGGGDDDFVSSAEGQSEVVDGESGDDVIDAGSGDDELTGGLGEDDLDGGDGIDTARFDDIDVGVSVDLAAGEAVRDTGFVATIENLLLVNPNGGINPAEIVSEGVDGNLYFNIHTSDFPSGELRGQLALAEDNRDAFGFGTVVFSAALDGAQETPAPVDTDASGEASVVFTLLEDGSIRYTTELSVSGLNQADLLPVNIGNGTLSPIHLHNAPVGLGGAVVVDIASDAGPEGIVAVSETDELTNIENVVGSNDADIIVGDDAANELSGLEGDDELSGGRGGDNLLGGEGNDLLRGGGGNDVIDGGEGIDTISFSDIGVDVNVTLNADGSGSADYIVNGNTVTDTFTGIENVEGSANNDTIIANGGAPNAIDGGAGNDFIAGGGGVDDLSGGEGVDTNSFINIGTPVVANLAAGTASYQPAPGVTVFEQFDGFENLDGSQNDDQLFGDGGDNALSGNDGDDLLIGRGGADDLSGGEGNDVLQGGGGNDALDGGEGVDTADFQDIGVAVTATLEDDGTGVASYEVNGNTVQDSLTSIENLTGSENDDSLSGNSEDNLLAGGAGNDELSGGDGNDVLRGDEVGSGTAVRVSVTNTLGEGGTFLTPVWFGFHNAENFDLFSAGEQASLGLERLAEDGIVEGIAAEFNAQAGDGGVDATIIGGAGAPGPIDPGETASFVLDVDPSQVGQGFFTWATMIIPSNDAFLASPDDARADAIFDENGNFLGPLVIERFGNDVLDAGTEVNNEVAAAFLNQTAANQGTTEGGVVGSHPGFNGSEGNPDGTPQNILGGTTAAGTIVDQTEGDFTRNGGNEQLLRIVVDRVANEGGADILNGGAGNDSLEGGGGRDTFVFQQGTGSDTVLDFDTFVETGDFIDVSDFNFADGDAVIAAAQQDGDNTVIDLGNGDQITLIGVDVGDLNAESFIVGEGPVEIDPIVVDGGRGAEEINGGAADDELNGGRGNDIINGGDGNDQINGGRDDDELDGGDGDDVINAGRGDDNVEGGDGNDVIDGGRGDDDINGGAGNDVLEGGRGDDNINGGAGNDFICAGTGDDIINGGTGNDRLEGGSGADIFVFETGTEDDTVLDFETGRDELDLTAFGFASFADVQAAAEDDGDDVVIDLGNGDSVTLVGVSEAELSQDDVAI
ncbi:spondin domain-containing protein [Pelagibius sp. Alg239-R121]|uniref:spondin domain-containing protein n=1 Tax=Pelagibius sp. Alg239-R121 TaxID=2993448 RepID=UPI0024A6C777|nr:spondin domain-containing protein [Pelagibius sp. Alg239-R121]